jgi:hypothetical protein
MVFIGMGGWVSRAWKIRWMEGIMFFLSMVQVQYIVHMPTWCPSCLLPRLLLVMLRLVRR